jgi:hypothetical protein
MNSKMVKSEMVVLIEREKASVDNLYAGCYNLLLEH